MNALATFAATKYIAVSYAAELRVWHQQCAPFGRKYISLVARMRCGGEPFGALKFYKTCGAIKFYNAADSL